MQPRFLSRTFSKVSFFVIFPLSSKSPSTGGVKRYEVIGFECWRVGVSWCSAEFMDSSPVPVLSLCTIGFVQQYCWGWERCWVLVYDCCEVDNVWHLAQYPPLVSTLSPPHHGFWLCTLYSSDLSFFADEIRYKKYTHFLQGEARTERKKLERILPQTCRLL